MIEFHFGGKRYSVSVEPYQWVLHEHYVNSKGKADTKTLGYYTRCEHLADKLARIAASSGAPVAGGDAAPVGETIALIRQMRDALQAVLGDLPPWPREA